VRNARRDCGGLRLEGGSGLALVRVEPDVCEVATPAARAISTRHGLSSIRQTAAIALRIPPRKRHSSSIFILIESNRSAQDDCGGVRLGWLGVGAREARAGRVRGRYTRGSRYLDASRLVKPPTDCCDRAQNTPAEASFELDLDRVKPVCARRLRRRTAWMGRAWRS
jgi:hypothetical protein